MRIWFAALLSAKLRRARQALTCRPQFCRCALMANVMICPPIHQYIAAATPHIAILSRPMTAFPSSCSARGHVGE